MAYQPPVAKLLTYGYLPNVHADQWPDYRAELGFGPEHIPDLIRMTLDDDLHEAHPDSHEIWSPIHAWRALGQMGAVEAVEPILSMLDDLAGDDWAIEELPDVFALIGPTALPMLATYLADADHHGIFGRSTVVTAIEMLAKRHPTARDECVFLLAGQLEEYDHNHDLINAFLINSLVELRAVEAAPIIERAFASKRVNLIVVGDWNETQVALGLKSPEELLERLPAKPQLVAKPVSHYRAKRKSRNKAAHTSQLKNRKRK